MNRNKWKLKVLDEKTLIMKMNKEFNSINQNVFTIYDLIINKKYDQYNFAQESLTWMRLKTLAMNAKNERIYRVQRAKISVKSNRQPDICICVWTYKTNRCVPNIRIVKNNENKNKKTKWTLHESNVPIDDPDVHYLIWTSALYKFSPF